MAKPNQGMWQRRLNPTKGCGNDDLTQTLGRFIAKSNIPDLPRGDHHFFFNIGLILMDAPKLENEMCRCTSIFVREKPLNRTKRVKEKNIMRNDKIISNSSVFVWEQISAVKENGFLRFTI